MRALRNLRLLVVLGALALASVPAAAQDHLAAPTRPSTLYEDLQMFSGVLNQVRVNHPDSVETHALIMAAIEGMIQAADPHSFVIPAIRLRPDRERALHDGKLQPVPITFTYFGGSPVVVSVVLGSSAAKADILPGDELVAIDGAPVSARSAPELDIALAGPKKSSVRLTVERRRVDGSFVQLDRMVRREDVDEATAVPAVFMLDAHTGYVRITTFANSKAAEDLHDALGTLERQGMQRLVLDLRDNGGGSIEEAARVAGEFLPKGAIVYTAAGRKAEVTDTGRVKRSFWRREKRYPITLLINAGSASASELVAGALQDHDRALIVGRPSFGKSLLMQGFPLPDGSVAVMVVGHVKTPCGRVIQRQYRGIVRRDYYRLARAVRDTAGRPSCKTHGGRTVYGGGGIYPDVALPESAAAPLWLARVYEEALPLKWTGGYVSANAARYPSLDALAAAPTAPPEAILDFRAFAEREGVTIPPGGEADMLLGRALVRWVAGTKWGDAGYYRVDAVLDGEVRAAVAAFDKAQAMLSAAH